jgi:hypothetical protein
MSKYSAYARLLVDGMPTKTFSLDTLAPPSLEKDEGRKEKVIRLSRERYATPREVVEDKIRRWSEGVNKEEPLPAGKSQPAGKPLPAQKSLVPKTNSPKPLPEKTQAPQPKKNN